VIGSRLAFALGEDDSRRFFAHQARSSSQGLRARWGVLLAGIAVALGVALLAPAEIVPRLAIAGVMAGIGAWLYVALPDMAAAGGVAGIRRDGESAWALRVWTVEDGGLRSTVGGQTALLPWSRIERVEETADAVYLFTGPRAAAIFPNRAFEGRAADFAAFARERAALARSAR
jgi:hypothetical protein